MNTEYSVRVANRTYEVSIQKDHLLVNGDRYLYEMDSLNGNGLHVLRQPHKNQDAYLENPSGGSLQVEIAGSHLSAEVVAGRQAAPSAAPTDQGSILSPMPGLITDVLIKVGDQVNKGDTLLVQEAMKMQMKIKAACSGIVKQIYAGPDSRVHKGFLLVSIEPVFGY